jgi:L-ascorbate metabolism protein UlaG (beta-lactamase superfamily)
MLKEYSKKSENREPKTNIEVEKISSSIFDQDSNITRLFWFGHSSFYLEMDGMKILIDPMLGNKPSPIPFMGPQRYSEELPIPIEEFSNIDAVIYSHDHYDHLDYGTIKKLKNKVDHFYVPLGVGNHLESWGVPKENISELNWWENIDFQGINLICAPSRHFSGRGMFNRASTLWCSWIIEGNEHKIYFSGDSGYDSHFKEIGDKYGPFDLSLIECGQYNPQWKNIHMMPEETIQAGSDLKSKLVLPIHWGAFTLAFHSWTDPIERALKKGEELNQTVITPKIGEPIVLGNDELPKEKWWLDYNR